MVKLKMLGNGDSRMKIEKHETPEYDQFNGNWKYEEAKSCSLHLQAHPFATPPISSVQQSKKFGRFSLKVWTGCIEEGNRLRFVYVVCWKNCQNIHN